MSTRTGTRDVKQPPGRPGPAGQGHTERSRKYSSVRRDSIGTSTVVRGRGGVGQTERRAPQESKRERER